jgi:MFS family permease
MVIPAVRRCKVSRKAAGPIPSGSPAPGLRGNRNWRLLWLGQSVSIACDLMFGITILLWIGTILCRGKAWAPAAASAALIAVAVPALAIGPFAGVYVDRWNRRRIMLTADAARGILIAGLLIIPVLGHRVPTDVKLGIIYVLIAAVSGFSQFFNPSRAAIIAAIVAPEDQPRASGQLQASAGLAQIFGPVAGAGLLITVGVQWALLLDAASFGVSFLCIRAIHPPAAAGSPRAKFGQEFGAGLRFFAHSKMLVTLGAGAAIWAMSAGAVNSLAVFFVEVNLRLPASWLGLVAGVMGAGAVAGALLAGRACDAVGISRVYWLALLGCGLALMAFSRATSLPAALVTGIALGWALGSLGSVFMPLMLRATPQHLIGRASAVINMAQEFASVTAMATAGFLVSTVLRGFHAHVADMTFGPCDSIYLVVGVLLVVAGLASVVPLRDIPQLAVTPTEA